MPPSGADAAYSVARIGLAYALAMLVAGMGCGALALAAVRP